MAGSFKYYASIFSETDPNNSVICGRPHDASSLTLENTLKSSQEKYGTAKAKEKAISATQ